MIIRASSADRFWACAASAVPDLRVDPINEAATDGTLAHAWLATLVRLGTLPEMPDCEAKFLALAGAKMWRDLSPSFPSPRCEVPLQADLDGWGLTGHPDVLSVVDARVLDWKSGRKDAAYEHQMRAYAVLVMDAYPDVTEVVSTIAWLRTLEIETYRTTISDAAEWVLEMGERLRHTDTYRPGPQCMWCPRAHECPGRSALARRAIADIIGQEAPSEALTRMPAGQIVELHRRAKLAAKASADVIAAIKAHVIDAGDVVADGERLTIETESRRKLDTAKAWAALQDAIPDDDDLLRCMVPSLSKINTVVAKAAGKGKGARAVRALDARLREAGAITETESKSLTSKRETI